MKRLFNLLFALCLLPYAYALYFWAFCSDCTVTGQSWFLTGILLFALPFLIAIYATVSAIGSARAARDNLVEHRPGKVLKSAFWLVVFLVIAIPAATTAYRLTALVTEQPEEGRDRLGRICVKEGSSTHCRPDPAKTMSTYEYLNRGRDRDQGR